ncbi:MAG: GH116 family glycosyl-hydrolase [Terriglobales bacterium]
MAKRPISRRKFLLHSSSAAGLMLAGGPCAGMPAAFAAETQTTSGDRSQTPTVQTRAVVPSCAWKRTLGDLPKIALMPEDGMPPQDRAGLNTLTRVKKGVPLGGIGAGNFMYNICGTFGPWQMKVGRYEERFLPQGAFHIREQVDGKSATTRTLATDDVLPAWPRLQPGQGEYYALFPRGWCTYRPFEANITLEFFTPVIKDNYRETSLPASLFRFRIHNPLSSPVEVSVMFTFPNAPYTGPQNTPMGKPKGADVDETARERRGLTNNLARDEHSGITAILMEAHHSTNPPETENSEWCIATNAVASHTTIWDGEGDGAEIWQDFSTDGELADKPLSLNSKLPSGALCVKVKVAPGSEVTVPFALTWYFPQIEFGQGTRWWRRYTEYYPAKPRQAFEIAKEALLKTGEWLQAVETWQTPIVQNPAYPEWLKQSVLNELYYTTFGGSFWENGCITKAKKFGGRRGQHLASVMECQEYGFAETFDVRHHVSRCCRDVWPAMERDILLVFSDFIMDTSDGSCPHDAGLIAGDPFFEYDGYGAGYNQGPGGIKGRVTTPWSEFSPKFIQQCHAYWHKTKDDNFVAEVWPSLVRSFRYQKSTDVDGDGLSEMKSSEYKDNKLFNAVLWLGALEALAALAAYRKETGFLEEVTAELNKARASTEQQFWNEQLGYYQYNARNQDIMGDAMIGQRFVDVTGLPPVLDPDRMTSHYRQLFRRAVLPLKDFSGDGVGDIGVANALHPDSTPGVGDSEYAHQFEVWTGVSYSAAANLYAWGKRVGDGSLQADALLTAWGVHSNTWVNEQTAYWFSTPEAWRLADPKQFRALMYQRARAIWEFAMEVNDPYQ